MQDKKDSYYFSHDAGARNDPRILALRSKHGIGAYGTYWVIIELLREQQGYMLKDDDSACPVIALSAGIPQTDADNIVASCVSSGLLVRSGGMLYSDSLIRRMKAWDDKKARLSEAGHKGGLASADSKALARHNQPSSHAQAMLKPSSSDAQAIRVDKIREDKKIEDKNIPDGFDIFWGEYPTGIRGKNKKGKARDWWIKHRPDSILQEKILSSLREHRDSYQWKQEDGKYIPDPITWLNAAGWESESKRTTEPPKPKTVGWLDISVDRAHKLAMDDDYCWDRDHDTRPIRTKASQQAALEAQKAKIKAEILGGIYNEPF